MERLFRLERGETDEILSFHVLIKVLRFSFVRVSLSRVLGKLVDKQRYKSESGLCNENIRNLYI